MRLGLLVHPNGLPEIVHAQQWTQSDVQVVLKNPVVESFPVGRDLLLWQAVVLDVERPVNEAAELLAEGFPGIHLRGTALVTRKTIGPDTYGGLDQRDVTRLTLKLATRVRRTDD